MCPTFGCLEFHDNYSHKIYFPKCYSKTGTFRINEDTIEQEHDISKPSIKKDIIVEKGPPILSATSASENDFCANNSDSIFIRETSLSRKKILSQISEFNDSNVLMKKNIDNIDGSYLFIKNRFEKDFQNQQDNLKRIEQTIKNLQSVGLEDPVKPRVTFIEQTEPSHDAKQITRNSSKNIQEKKSGNKTKTSTAMNRFIEIEEFATPIIDAYRRVLGSSEKSISQIKLKIRMSVNKKIGQIANSVKQIHEIVYELDRIIYDAWQRFGDDMANYCIVVIANKFIEQAETQISLHPASAFCFAQAIVDLGVKQKSLVLIFVDLIMRRCPYAIPRYIKKEDKENLQEHKIAMGYLYLDNEIEGDQAYIERMSGMLSLFGAVLQAKPVSGDKNPYDFENAWLWAASILNITPEPITPFLICSFLDSCGYALWKTYTKHFVKLMEFIRDEYIDMIPPGSVSATTRLEIYLDSFFKSNPPSLPIPRGSVLLD